MHNRMGGRTIWFAHDREGDNLIAEVAPVKHPDLGVIWVEITAHVLMLMPGSERVAGLGLYAGELCLVTRPPGEMDDLRVYHRLEELSRNNALREVWRVLMEASAGRMLQRLLEEGEEVIEG